ncbi:MAG: hypothetical protein ACW98K_08925, partial [Candidatus Kariarchaeaceae archaeon]
MRIYFHENQVLHHPQLEFTGNGMREYPETPNRMTYLLSTINGMKNENIETVQPILCDKSIISLVHDLEYIEFLESIPDGIDGIAPTGFPLPNNRIKPISFEAKLGSYFFDPATPVTSYTYDSAHASVSTAVAMAKELLNNHMSIGLCRPPGHHAFPSMGGGYCFFNNMAIAAKMIRSQGKTVS